jgi:hypothetical protein
MSKYQNVHLSARHEGRWRSGGTAPRHQVTVSRELHNPTGLHWGVGTLLTTQEHHLGSYETSSSK